MNCTKERYIKMSPGAYLSAALSANDWPGDTEIEIGHGRINSENKTSNLYKALKRSTWGEPEFAVGALKWKGGGARWFAVAIKQNKP